MLMGQDPRRKNRSASTAPIIRHVTSASREASIWPDISGGYPSPLLPGRPCPIERFRLTDTHRKHTGERPFQCHCSRRFSRLDNLRQHAQTVHVNEDIPMNSLAATGTRFQRQIRTDRVRTSTGRARTSSNAGMGAPAKGHSKSLSTSSISSVGSTFSGRDEVRRRPPPLVMADPRSRLPIESYQRSPGEGAYALRPVSPSEFSTPTSATFSTAQSSPRWASSIASPTSSHSRSHSMYASSRIPARRLSVPSGGIPFHSPHGAPFGRPPYGSSSSTSTAGPYSPISSVMASPTSSVFSRRESTVSNADEAWRRRTWHPDSSNFGGMPSSRLSNAYTPSQLQSPVAGGTPPMANQATLQQAPLRLPGIESFDPVHRPATPPRRNPSPMMVDADSSHPPPRLLPAADVHSDGRRNTANWGMSLHQGLTRLDLKNKTPPRDEASAWAQETSQAVEAEAERARYNVPTVRFNEPVVVYDAPPVRMNSPSRPSHQHTMSAPAFSRPREARRHGWYQSPVEVHADGPPERIARVDRMVHPNINQFPGFPAREAPSPPQPSAQDAPGDRDNMLRLQALVAVATSEGNAAKAY